VANHDKSHENPNDDPNPDDPADTRLHQPILRWADITPDAIALTDGHGAWTYWQLRAAVEHAASILQWRGVRAGDRVMLVGENGRTLAAFILAVSLLDACAVLENARRAPLETERIRAHANPRLVVYLLRDSDAAKEHAARAQAREKRCGPLGRVAISHDNPASEVGTCGDMCTGTRDDVAALIYTTGTTGTPKGVMVRHEALLFLPATVRCLRAITPADHAYGVLPITHIMGLAIVMGSALRAGARLTLAARFDAGACAALLQDDGLSMLQGAPAMFAKLLQYLDERPLVSPPVFPRLRFIAVGGAPLDLTLKRCCETVFGLPLHNGYGLTEGSSLCFTRLDDPRPDASVGRPLPGVAVRIVGKGGVDLPAGAVGELWVRGPQVMKGYFREPALTRRVLSEDGWFNTEDLARVDDVGNVSIVGRSKDLINSNGFNVYPQEVEEAINAHPGVVHSAVVGRADADSETVIAFVELRDGNSSFDLTYLQTLFAQRLSPYKKPREIYVLTPLPASPNGKVLKHQLRAMLADGSARRLPRIL